jgi:Arc/MetJ-type ribon-helix-helix transcriptional regulator
LSAKEGKTEKYATISIPSPIMKAIDELKKDPGYWPSRGAFVREACLEKIHKEKEFLKDLRETRKGSEPTG